MIDTRKNVVPPEMQDVTFTPAEIIAVRKFLAAVPLSPLVPGPTETDAEAKSYFINLLADTALNSGAVDAIIERGAGAELLEGALALYDFSLTMVAQIEDSMGRVEAPALPVPLPTVESMAESGHPFYAEFAPDEIVCGVNCGCAETDEDDDDLSDFPDDEIVEDEDEVIVVPVVAPSIEELTTVAQMVLDGVRAVDDDRTFLFVLVGPQKA